MNIEELRFIVRQQKASYLFSVFQEYWVTDEVLAQSLAEIDPLFSQRLEMLKGVSRGDYKDLALPKRGGGLMKPGLSNASYGAKAALWNLARVLRQKNKRLQLEVADRQATHELICPHCGCEVKISITVT